MLHFFVKKVFISTHTTPNPLVIWFQSYVSIYLKKMRIGFNLFLLTMADTVGNIGPPPVRMMKIVERLRNQFSKDWKNSDVTSRCLFNK